MTDPARARPVLPRWVTLWFWLGLLGFIVVVRLTITDWQRWRFLINDEPGLIENASVLFAAAAAVLSFRVWRRRGRLPRRWLGGWFLLCALGCLVYAGEEASWGQHWFSWTSPEFFAEHNRQGELNLHNLAREAQRWPKAAMTAGVIVAGVLIPLFRRGPGPAKDSPAWWWLPEASTFPLAVLVLLTRILERIRTWGDLHTEYLWDIEVKEANEMLIAGFFLLYAWSVWRRIAGESRASRHSTHGTIALRSGG